MHARPVPYRAYTMIRMTVASSYALSLETVGLEKYVFEFVEEVNGRRVNGRKKVEYGEYVLEMDGLGR